MFRVGLVGDDDSSLLWGLGGCPTSETGGGAAVLSRSPWPSPFVSSNQASGRRERLSRRETSLVALVPAPPGQQGRPRDLPMEKVTSPPRPRFQ